MSIADALRGNPCSSLVDGAMSHTVLAELTANGIYARWLSEGDGKVCLAADALGTLCDLRRTIARERPAIDRAVWAHLLAVYAMASLDQERPDQTLLASAVRGETILSYIPPAHTGATSLTDGTGLRVSRGGMGSGHNSFVLSGHSGEVPNCINADAYLLFADCEEEGLNSYLLQRNRKGLTVESVIDNESERARLIANQCEVGPADIVIDGKLANRVHARVRGLDGLGEASRALGLAEHAYAVARAAALEERGGGRGVDQQAVSFLLADMYGRVAIARASISHHCRVDQDDEVKLLVGSSMAKLYSVDAANDVVRKAEQIVGTRAEGFGKELRDLALEIRESWCLIGTGLADCIAIFEHAIAAKEMDDASR